MLVISINCLKKTGLVLKNLTVSFGTTDIIENHKSYRRFRPRMAVNKIPDGTRMVVVKCPTYYPGDIRILVQKNIPELSHLTDVVVFSTDGSAKRPVPHEIHESDLDGDEYFVCWDQDLVPKQEMEPMKPTKREKVPHSNMLLKNLRVESPP